MSYWKKSLTIETTITWSSHNNRRVIKRFVTILATNTTVERLVSTHMRARIACTRLMLSAVLGIVEEREVKCQDNRIDQEYLAKREGG